VAEESDAHGVGVFEHTAAVLTVGGHVPAPPAVLIRDDLLEGKELAGGKVVPEGVLAGIMVRLESHLLWVPAGGQCSMTAAEFTVSRFKFHCYEHYE
jgi:hypothetical protein